MGYFWGLAHHHLTLELPVQILTPDLLHYAGRVFSMSVQIFFAESNSWLISKLCFPKHILLHLCHQLSPVLERELNRTNAIPVHTQVLSILGFMTTETFQWEIADRSGISQPTMSRILPTVLHGIISLTPQYIQFLYTAVQQARVKRDFHTIAGFPNVIGAIDCTHITVKAQSLDKFNFANRKGFHSVNVQVICDSHLALLNVVTKWPGGTHDSFIVQNSSETGATHLKTWLMTPLTNPSNQQDARYNQAHARTRTTVERTIGLLKGHWLCLSGTGGTCNTSLVSYIVKACSVLHNIAIKNGIPLNDLPRPGDPMPDRECFPPPITLALRTRVNIIQRF
uniref:Putative nuclease HARBI1 n=1 Tax=Oncorhynchus tshawytscha TaxID=74940 RepID=A0AAZ3RJJ0_ONCTS